MFYLLNWARCLLCSISRTMETQQTHSYLCYLETFYKHVTTVLNRPCHCKLYSFGLELKTSIAKAIDEADKYLTPEIVTREKI